MVRVLPTNNQRTSRLSEEQAVVGILEEIFFLYSTSLLRQLEPTIPITPRGWVKLRDELMKIGVWESMTVWIESYDPRLHLPVTDEHIQDMCYMYSCLLSAA